MNTPGSDGLNIYMREIGKTPLLTRKEERELGFKTLEGDPEARDRMIRSNLRLVVKIAKDYSNYGLPLADLIAEGNVGLMKAVERFDPDKGAKFSTYGAWWIKQCIKRALANQSKTIRLPVHMVEKISKMRRTAMLLTEELGREPTDDELARELEVSVAKLARMQNAAMTPLSLDAPIGEDGSTTTLGEVIADTGAVDASDLLIGKDMLHQLDPLLEVLDEREYKIVEARFGLNGKRPQTLEEVGEEFGVTRERIRQLQNIALKKMRLVLKKRDDPNKVTEEEMQIARGALENTPLPQPEESSTMRYNGSPTLSESTKIEFTSDLGAVHRALGDINNFKRGQMKNAFHAGNFLKHVYINGKTITTASFATGGSGANKLDQAIEILFFKLSIFFRKVEGGLEQLDDPKEYLREHTITAKEIYGLQNIVEMVKKFKQTPGTTNPFEDEIPLVLTAQIQDAYSICVPEEDEKEDGEQENTIGELVQLVVASVEKIYKIAIPIMGRQADHFSPSDGLEGYEPEESRRIFFRDELSEILGTNIVDPLTHATQTLGSKISTVVSQIGTIIYGIPYMSVSEVDSDEVISRLTKALEPVAGNEEFFASVETLQLQLHQKIKSAVFEGIEEQPFAQKKV